MDKGMGRDCAFLRLKIFLIFLAAGLMMTGKLYAAAPAASDAAEPVQIKTLENVKGEVVRIEGRMLSIVYSRTKNAEYEKFLPIDEEVELNGYKTTADIKPGDRVELVCEKTVINQGTPEEKNETVVKKIRLIKRSVQNPSLYSSEGDR
ncbi:MAG: hypothetical protein A3D87_01745 [Omnitrophica WOR_2 bacterium RIFCSPHIGHO2_02_FULL_50_17]|nr:MAG: hypothetical protein A3D87_01745 [Omnitrophica WOR_2 bacterium RIFCSPHIGHO2_02_FULL_50_17]